nr:AraC family transcriptional regulator ligand-binding domain-containing protein [Oceanococcus sp. HetDA_MAG_MS8]
MTLALELPALSVLMAACSRSGSDLGMALDSFSAGQPSGEQSFRDLSLQDVAQLLLHLESSARRQHFPFAVADAFHFDGEPALNTFLTSADSLREALRLLDWVPSLIHPSIGFVPAEPPGQRAQMQVQVLDPGGRNNDLPVFVEMIMAVMWRCCCTIAGELQIQPRVVFAHAPRATVDAYREFFGVVPEFGQVANALHLPADVLDLRLPGRLPQAHARAEEHIRQILGQVDPAQPLRPQIESLLRQQRHLLAQGIDAVAASLHMHPRTLQRRLRAENCRYSELLAELRHQLACDWLSNSAWDLEKISEELGFSDRRSFTQAFGQRQGQTPSAFRKARQEHKGQT